MRKTWAIFFCACVLIIMCIPTQSAQSARWTSTVTVLVEGNDHNLLGSHTFTSSGSIPSDVILSDLVLTFNLTAEGLWGQPLFDKILVFGNTGNTMWIANNADDPNYNTLVERLTDNRSDALYGFFTLRSPHRFVCGETDYVGGGEDVCRESSFIGTGRPDFSGMTIEKIGLRIDQASILDGAAAVPEPASLVTLACGIFGVGGLALRRRR